MGLSLAEESGIMSTAAAVMAASHRGAWNMALRIAKANHLYGSVEDLKESAARVEQGKALYVKYNQSYAEANEGTITREVIAHACSFASSQRDDFPDWFKAKPDQYLDWFIRCYQSQVWIKRHKLQALDEAIAVVKPEAIIGQLVILGDETALKAQPYRRRIVTTKTAPTICHVSLAAREAVLPDVGRAGRGRTPQHSSRAQH